MPRRAQPRELQGPPRTLFRRAAALLVVAAPLAPGVALASTGASTCACLTDFPSEWDSLWVPNGTCQLVPGKDYTGNAASPDYCYPVNYGLTNCQPWDQSQAPFCDVASPPSWCSNVWCYVNASACALVDGDATASVRTVPGAASNINPHYSYATCGTTSIYAKYQRSAVKTASEIVAIVEGYVAQLRDRVEQQHQLVVTSEGSTNCVATTTDSCTCCPNLGSGTWQPASGASSTATGYNVDFTKVSLTYVTGTKDGALKERQAQCLAQQMEPRLKDVARLEYNDPVRMGFLQYGDQASGVYFSWPAVKLCGAYDPRYRPWYVGAVSGPKDVVLVVDRSESMKDFSRWTLAKQAAVAVLDTLTEFDHVNVVVFSTASDVYADLTQLRPATKQNKDLMKAWLTGNTIQPIGSTNFLAGFTSAFSLLANTLPSRTSSCNRAILFLTDGVDRYGVQASDVTSRNTLGAAIFTYSFGNSADATLTKQIACQNKGIWHKVQDQGNIQDVMSNYYTYYAGPLATQKLIRWEEYEEFRTENTLITGCLPAYQRPPAVATPQLLGVVCMDVSVIIDIAQFTSKSDYQAARTTMRQQAATCSPVSQSEADLERLRALVSAESVCDLPDVSNGAGRAPWGGAAPRLALAALAVAARGALE